VLYLNTFVLVNKGENIQINTNLIKQKEMKNVALSYSDQKSEMTMFSVFFLTGFVAMLVFGYSFVWSIKTLSGFKMWLVGYPSLTMAVIGMTFGLVGGTMFFYNLFRGSK